MSGRRARRYLPWLGLPVSGAFLYLALREGDARAVLTILAGARAGHVALAGVLALGGLVLMALRWRLLLRPVARVGLGRAFSLLTIGYAVNYLVPGRLGEVTRACLLGTFAGVSRVAALATVVVEKVLDGLVLLGLLLLLLRLAPLPAGAEQLGLYGSVVFFGAAGGLVAARVFGPRARRLGQRAFGRIPGVGARCIRAVESIGQGLATIELSRRTALVVTLSFAIWGQQALVVWVLLRGLAIELSLSAALVLVVALALGSMIPAAPGFVGTYQLVAVGVLAGFGISPNEALAFSLLLHSTEYALVLGTSLAGLAAERMSFYRLFALARSTQADAGGTT